MKQIDPKKRKNVIEALTGVLADTFVLYYKTHAYHFNIEGEDFREYHLLFEDQYNELWKAVDVLAERIRSLDSYAPVSLKALLAQSSIKESGQNIRDARQMAKDLADDHEDLAQSLSKAIHLADEANDLATSDLLTGRLGAHEKTAWMLRASTK